MPDSRENLAARLAAAVGGWLSELAARDLDRLPKEDSLRLKVSELISSRGLIVHQEQRAPNWPPESREQFDVGMRAGGASSVTWYGFAELKWPQSNPAQYRLPIVQDAVRLAGIQTPNLRYRFLVLAGPWTAIDALFTGSVGRRLTRFFSRDWRNPWTAHSRDALTDCFPEAYARVPTVIRDSVSRLSVGLLAHHLVRVGRERRGEVWIWQCQRNR